MREASRYEITAAGPVVLITAPEPTNSPAPSEIMAPGLVGHRSRRWNAATATAPTPAR